MQFSDYLAEEWRPALGCTEPASIAFAAASAARALGAPVERIELTCDSRMFKNCFAVGIPYSGHRVGLRWAVAIGSQLSAPELQLECFRAIGPDTLTRASALLDAGAVSVQVDPSRDELFIRCRLWGGGAEALAVIEADHTRLVRLEQNGRDMPIPQGSAAPPPPKAVAARDDGSPAPAVRTCASPGEGRSDPRGLRAELGRARLSDLIALARGIGPADRARLQEGVRLNLAIAEHGLSLFPERFAAVARARPGADSLSRQSRLVCAGVYARMWGEDLSVMSLAGSGNKGIVAAVPLWLRGEELGVEPGRVEEALALTCLVTSATTHHLGTLSAVCGCSNAAGIGLATGIVLLEGGDEAAISRALSNMVGNVTGMICDGAKIGCALKTMTAVDAAFRAASLALEGVGIPYTDGIVGRDGFESLAHLGRIATRGMAAVDAEILAIMQAKLC